MIKVTLQKQNDREVEFIKEIDLDNKRLEINEIEGLLNEN